jgi:hypothetical protein
MSDQLAISNILFSSSMIKWGKAHAPEMMKQFKPKRLPPSKDNTVGNLNEQKITVIQDAYDNGEADDLPAINVKQYKATGYYEVIDGRHRVVTALKNGKQYIKASLAEYGGLVNRSSKGKRKKTARRRKTSARRRKTSARRRKTRR